MTSTAKVDWMAIPSWTAYSLSLADCHIWSLRGTKSQGILWGTILIDSRCLGIPRTCGIRLTQTGHFIAYNSEPIFINLTDMRIEMKAFIERDLKILIGNSTPGWLCMRIDHCIARRIGRILLNSHLILELIQIAWRKRIIWNCFLKTSGMIMG